MPYVDIDSRDKYAVKARVPINPGGLNYQITQLVINYVKQNSATAGGNPTGLNYTLLNEVIGALECAKQEFYRRAVVPYESQKIQDNGDLYN